MIKVLVSVWVLTMICIIVKTLRKKKITSTKVYNIKKRIKDGTYNWEKSIEGAADRIIQYPESLIWK